MREDEDKIPVAIYRIDPESGFLPTDGFDSVVDHIIKNYNQRNAKNGRRFDEEPLEAGTDSPQRRVRIYSSERASPPRWRSFLEAALGPTARLGGKVENVEFSFVCFIGYPDKVFAVAGGQGSMVVQRYIDSNFGLQVLSHLVSPEDRAIKSIQERGVTGSIVGSTKFFRGNQRLASEDRFGKIYNLIRANLKKEILIEEFGFSEDDFKRAVSGCLAKSSFQISKSISFGQLLGVVDRIVAMLGHAGVPGIVNKVRLLGRSGKGAELVTSLKARLLEILYAKYSGSDEGDFDLCHKDFDKYLTAETYTLSISGKDITHYVDGENPSLGQVIDALHSETSFKADSQDEFNRAIQSVSIKSFDGEGGGLTDDRLVRHLHGEIEMDGKTYFTIDLSWYAIDPGFVDELNEECDDTVSESWEEGVLDRKFEAGHDEQKYIELYLGRESENFYVLHKITPEGIEMCDLIKVQGSKVYLIHIKVGFENSIRELAGQLTVAAKRFARDHRTGHQYLSKMQEFVTRDRADGSVYSRALAAQKFPEGGLPALFRGKKLADVVFCFAFVDTAKTERTLKGNAKSFRSNIAKISLVNLGRDIGEHRFPLVVTQIRKS